MAEYDLAGKLSDFPPGNLSGCQVEGIAIANVGGRLCAFSDCCTHENVSFVHGYGVLFKDSVICMLHAATFDAASGAVQSGPASSALRTYDLKVDGENVFVSRLAREE